MATKTDGTQLDASEWTVYVSDRTHARLAARKTKALRTMDAVIASLLDGAELQQHAIPSDLVIASGSEEDG